MLEEVALLRRKHDINASSFDCRVVAKSCESQSICPVFNNKLDILRRIALILRKIIIPVYIIQSFLDLP